MHSLAIISNILSTALAWYGVRGLFRGTSAIAQLAIGWMIGQVFVTSISYILSCFLVPYLSPTLFFTNLVIVLSESVLCCCLLVFQRETIRLWWNDMRRAGGGWRSSCLFGAVSLAVSIVLFKVHLFEQDGVLHRSHIYWDVTAHYPIIQSFVFGDNFPARDETAAELPLFYHFFGDLQVANNVALGSSLPAALLWVSALSLTSLMILVREYARLLFKVEAAGWIAGLLVVTSSNLRWIFDFFESSQAQYLLRPLFTRGYPMRFSNPEFSFGKFNLSMFNIFYFIEERHVLFASALVVVTALLVRENTILLRRTAFLCGCVIACFTQWNFFIFPMLIVIVASGFALHDKRPYWTWTLVTLLVLGGLTALSMRSSIIASGWFDVGHHLPRFNFRFAAENEKAAYSFSRFLSYYCFAMGPTLLGALVGIVVMWRTTKRDFWIIVPVLLVTFALINSVEVMPSGIYENHKWVKPLQSFLNILAVAPCALVLQSRSRLRFLTTACMVMVLTISGVFEAIAFTRSFSMPIAPYPSEMINLIRERTRPHDVFVTSLPREVLLAGRRVYFLHLKNLEGTIPHIKSLGFKFSKRAEQEARFYQAANLEQFCATAQELQVDVIEFSPQQQKLPVYGLVRENEIFSVTPYKETEPRSYISSRFCGLEFATR